jgi:hypothetical protein
MNSISKSFALILILTVAISSLSLITVKPAFGQIRLFPFPTPETQNYSIVLHNYAINYSIVKMPPPDYYNQDVYAYNLIVNGPAPFPLQISFYEKSRENVTQQVVHIIPTSSLSETAGCTSYPTNITFTELSNEPISKPTSTTRPTPTLKPSIITTLMPTQPPTATTAGGAPSISLLLLTNAIALAVIAVLLTVIIALLLFIRKRKPTN